MLYLNKKHKIRIHDVFDNIEQLIVKVHMNGLRFVVCVTYKPANLTYKYFIGALENVVCVDNIYINFLNYKSLRRIFVSIVRHYEEGSIRIRVHIYII